MSGKFALVIGNTEYIDPGLAQLTAPGRDTEDFARVLSDQEICAFDQVNILLNQLSSTVIEVIDAFFDQKKPDDLLVLYFSGHGVRDELGSLYLAVSNTIRSRLRSTAVKSDYIREVMDQSRSKRQVVILDCCNSGAFPQGTKAEVGGMMGMVSALQGYGRFVLTASDATQFAWEGDKAIGETQNSLFTHFVVKGLKGEADSDSDGNITVDELYDYAYEQIARLTPKQTPTKSASKQEGEIVLRQNMRIEDIKPVPLPAPLLDAIENPFAEIRLGAVQQLTKLSKGKNLGLARSAREALKKIAVEDDSHRVVEASAQALESLLEKERATREAVRKARHDTLRLAAEQEAARLKATGEAVEKAAREKAEKEAAEKTTEESGKIATPQPASPLPVLLQSKGSPNWGWWVSIVGGLCVIGLGLFWLGNVVFPPFVIVATESTDIATIASTNIFVPTTTPSLMATTALIAASTNTEYPFPSPTNSEGGSPNPVIFPPTRVPTLAPTLTPSLTLTLTPSPTNTDTPTPDPCGPLPTHVSIGMTIQVKVESLGIRPQPDLDAHRIFELFRGDQMTVSGGPKCAWSSYFWYITSQEGVGWVREGNGVIYFVEPVP